MTHDVVFSPVHVHVYSLPHMYTHDTGVDDTGVAVYVCGLTSVVSALGS